MRTRAVAPLLAAALLLAPSARAEDADERADARAGAALIVGSLTATLPFLAGATLIATGTDITQRNAGTYLAEAGLVLAPLTAHGVMGEWGRGLLHSAWPAVGMGGMTTLLLLRPDVVEGGTLGTQYAYVSIMIFTVFSSAVGVADAMRAKERARAPVRVAPMVGNGRVGIVLGGTL